MEDEFYQRGLEAAQDYVSGRPDWKIRLGEPFVQGNSHQMIRAERDGTPIVFKFYANQQSKIRELAALRHLASSGLVPKVIDDTPERLLVLTELPGRTLRELLDEDTGQESREWQAILREIGQALAKWKRVPFVKLPQVAEALREWLRTQLDASWRVYEREASYHTDFFRRSLELQEQHLSAISVRPVFLCNMDMNPENILAHQGHLQGFVDLESARPGTEPLQLGVLLFSLAAYAYNRERISLLWQCVLQGYTEETGQALPVATIEEAVAMCHFKYWTFINGDSASDLPDGFVLPNASRVADVLETCERLSLSPTV